MQALAKWRHAANSSGVDHVSMSLSMAKDTLPSLMAIFASYRTIWAMLCSNLLTVMNTVR